MIWNLYPLAPILAVPGTVLNIVFWPFRLATLWIEYAWNIFYVLHNLVAFMMWPYYLVAFIGTISLAMDQRDMYAQNNPPDMSVLLFDFMGWEPMAEVLGPTY